MIDVLLALQLWHHFHNLNLAHSRHLMIALQTMDSNIRRKKKVLTMMMEWEWNGEESVSAALHCLKIALHVIVKAHFGGSAFEHMMWRLHDWWAFACRTRSCVIFVLMTLMKGLLRMNWGSAAHRTHHLPIEPLMPIVIFK